MVSREEILYVRKHRLVCFSTQYKIQHDTSWTLAKDSSEGPPKCSVAEEAPNSPSGTGRKGPTQVFVPRGLSNLATYMANSELGWLSVSYFDCNLSKLSKAVVSTLRKLP